jgi:hypothetical protein
LGKKNKSNLKLTNANFETCLVYRVWGAKILSKWATYLNLLNVRMDVR